MSRFLYCSRAKFIFCVCLFLVLGGTVQAQLFKKKKNLPELPAAIPQPKLVFETRWALSTEDNSLKPLYQKSELEFDSLERPIYRREYNAKGEPRQIYTYSYSPDALQMQCFLSSPLQGDTAAKEDHQERYNAQGKLLEKQSFKRSGELLQRQVFDYDAEQRLIKEVIYDAKGQKIQELTIVYDDDQYNYTEYYTDLLAKKSYHIAVALDTFKLPRERHRYQSSGSLVDKVLFIRDEEGRLVQKSSYRPNDSPLRPAYKEDYSYPEANQKVQTTSIEGEITSRVLYKYQYRLSN